MNHFNTVHVTMYDGSTVLLPAARQQQRSLDRNVGVEGYAMVTCESSGVSVARYRSGRAQKAEQIMLEARKIHRIERPALFIDAEPSYCTYVHERQNVCQQ